MGRNKIEIKYLPDTRNRHTTYRKRKYGLMKKALELSKLTASHVAILILNEKNELDIYSSNIGDIELLLHKYETMVPHEHLSNEEVDEAIKHEERKMEDRKKRNEETGGQGEYFQVPAIINVQGQVQAIKYGNPGVRNGKILNQFQPRETSVNQVDLSNQWEQFNNLETTEDSMSNGVDTFSPMDYLDIKPTLPIDTNRLLEQSPSPGIETGKGSYVESTKYPNQNHVNVSGGNVFSNVDQTAQSRVGSSLTKTRDKTGFSSQLQNNFKESDTKEVQIDMGQLKYPKSKMNQPDVVLRRRETNDYNDNLNIKTFNSSNEGGYNNSYFWGESSPAELSYAYVGKWMGKDEKCKFEVRGVPIAIIKDHLISAFSTIEELSFSVASPTSFNLNYKSEPHDVNRIKCPVMFRIYISPVPTSSQDKNALHIVNFVHLEGHTSDFVSISDHIFSEMVNTLHRPFTSNGRQLATSGELSGRSSGASDTSGRHSAFSNTDYSGQSRLEWDANDMTGKRQSNPKLLGGFPPKTISELSTSTGRMGPSGFIKKPIEYFIENSNETTKDKLGRPKTIETLDSNSNNKITSELKLRNPVSWLKGFRKEEKTCYVKGTPFAVVKEALINSFLLMGLHYKVESPTSFRVNCTVSASTCTRYQIESSKHPVRFQVTLSPTPIHPSTHESGISIDFKFLSGYCTGFQNICVCIGCLMHNPRSSLPYLELIVSEKKEENKKEMSESPQSLVVNKLSSYTPKSANHGLESQLKNPFFKQSSNLTTMVNKRSERDKVRDWVFQQEVQKRIKTEKGGSEMDHFDNCFLSDVPNRKDLKLLVNESDIVDLDGNKDFDKSDTAAGSDHEEGELVIDEGFDLELTNPCDSDKDEEGESECKVSVIVQPQEKTSCKSGTEKEEVERVGDGIDQFDLRKDPSTGTKFLSEKKFPQKFLSDRESLYFDKTDEDILALRKNVARSQFTSESEELDDSLGYSESSNQCESPVESQFMINKRVNQNQSSCVQTEVEEGSHTKDVANCRGQPEMIENVEQSKTISGQRLYNGYSLDSGTANPFENPLDLTLTRPQNVKEVNNLECDRRNSSRMSFIPESLKGRILKKVAGETSNSMETSHQLKSVSSNVTSGLKHHNNFVNNPSQKTDELRPHCTSNSTETQDDIVKVKSSIQNQPKRLKLESSRISQVEKQNLYVAKLSEEIEEKEKRKNERPSSAMSDSDVQKEWTRMGLDLSGLTEPDAY